MNESNEKISETRLAAHKYLKEFLEEYQEQADGGPIYLIENLLCSLLQNFLLNLNKYLEENPSELIDPTEVGIRETFKIALSSFQRTIDVFKIAIEIEYPND